MAGRKKTWQEKLHNGQDPKVVVTTKPYAGLPPGTRLLVGTPLLVKDYIEKIAEERPVTIAEMRRDLAERFGADAMCPTSTGIFVRIVTEAAKEEEALTGKTSTPYERLLPNPAKSGSRYRAR